jgi:arsenate reductase (thioredoxin)
MLKKIISTSIFFSFVFFAVGQKSVEKNKDTKQIILFVCEHGAARSTIAAAYFNKLAKEQGLNYIAVFKGTDPDTVLTPAIAKGLVKDSFDISGWTPKLVSGQDIKSAYKIVTFDCKLPTQDSVSIPAEQWNGIPAISKDYNIARNEIVEKVNQLITELPKTQKKKTKKQKVKKGN